MQRFTWFVLLAALAACAPANLDQPEQWRAVNVTATPVAFGAETVGRLRFRGGLELHSPDTVFGGLSGLEVLDDGRLFAISDNGDWFEGQIQLDEGGALVGLSGVRTAFMRDESGELFPSKEEGDSEGLAQLPDGRFAVSFEQTQSIRLYDMNRDGPFGAATPGPRLAGTQRLPDNAGLEALAATAGGELVVGAEGLPAPKSAGNVLRPKTVLKLSLRLPPTVDAEVASKALKKALTVRPIQGASVKFEAEQASPGWNAPPLSSWLEKSIHSASKAAFGRQAALMGEGGSIPFIGMLGKKFPKAQFLITGVLGPHSNAHGPNEFLHIPTGRNVTACAAMILADHGARDA